VGVAILRSSEFVMLADYKIVLYRQEDKSWVAEIPSISGCYALMPTRQEALSELENVFEMIVAEYREAGRLLPKDTTEIVHA
jgi:predicted RNase H-like HicB family nuclease